MLQSLFKEKYGIPLDEIKRRHTYADSKFIQVQGMDVHYRDVGEGPVLILLHGMFSSLHTWEEWIDTLKEDFRVIALDAPNYGLTGAHPKGMFKHIYSDFLNDFTDALGISECMLAGNSLGGWMSWEFAGRYPEKVKKVILIDDSIVRGTNMKKIVSMLKDAGAKEIHVRIASPPFVNPCYYGIDTPTKQELIASNI